MPDVLVQPGPAALARTVAGHFATLAGEAIAGRGRFAVALAGGSTPRAAYALLATGEFAGRVDLPRVHVFWGDERCVPPNHPDSNYRLARETLLDHVPIPAGNVHRMRGEEEPMAAAAAYERDLRAFFAVSSMGAVPCFDLALLGLGDDGHTASLFPGTAAIHEAVRWVVAHHVDKLGMWRVTLTPIAINSAAQVTFVVSGAGKAGALHEVRGGPYQPDVLPAQIVRPTAGRLLWLVDAAAAGQQGGNRDDTGG